jgi:hypothetical protein
MSSNQPLPGNTPIPEEKPDNGDWSARAFEAVRAAVEGQDVPKESGGFGQLSSDEQGSSASPHPDCGSSEREEPLATCVTRLTAPPGDRLSLLATEPSGQGRRWVPVVALVTAAFGLGWTAGADYYGQVNRNSTSVSSAPKLITPAFILGPGIASDSGPYGISGKSHRSVRDRRTIRSGGGSTKAVEKGSSSSPKKAALETATPSPQLPVQVTSSIRDPIEPLVEAKPKRVPIPDTRPTTIEGWTIREVRGSTAVLEGPDGIQNTAAVGDTIPGVGRIDSIVRWGNRWLVATSSGLVTTP